MNKFITKDSGKRQDYKSGMRRDIQEGKPRYDLLYFPVITEWANLMSRGAVKYGENNWKLANSIEELNRFKASAFRHFYQFMSGEEDECHYAAILFNVAACVYLMNKLGVDINGNNKNESKNPEYYQRQLENIRRWCKENGEKKKISDAN